MSTNTRRNLLRRAANLVVVDDGASRWVGSRREVYRWLSTHDVSRGFDRSTNLPNAATMDAEQYQSLCDETQCYVDTSGSYGPAGQDPHKLIGAILDRDAPTLYVR